MDLFIVVISLIELTIQESNISSLKVLRLLRTLRPLRFITHNISMKIVVNAIFNSVTAIFNVGVVIFIVWLIFAIFGVAIFSGKFYSCGNEELSTEEECEKYG